MKNSFKLIALFIICGFAGSVVLSSCEKKDEHTPPKIVFKTGAGYTSGNAIVGKDSTIKVGVTCDKTEDELSKLNVSYAYDGATTTTTKDDFTIAAADEDHFEKDYTIKARSTAGSEKWTFTVTDRDGNLSNVSLTLTVN
jgi:hypothetical protein